MEPTTPHDAELVGDALAGNREAFGLLYDRHVRMVRAVVLGASGDWSASDDMTQECFLRAYRKLAELRERERFGPWIVGIARHVARERRRSLARDRHEFGALPPEAPSHDGHVIDRDRIEQVLSRLAELPVEERLAIHAYYFEEQNARQAAERLEVSRSGYYALLARALAKLATRPQTATSKSEATT